MRNLLSIIGILFSSVCYTQTYTQINNYGQTHQRIKVTGNFKVPFGNSFFRNTNDNAPGDLYLYLNNDSSALSYHDGTRFKTFVDSLSFTNDSTFFWKWGRKYFLSKINIPAQFNPTATYGISLTGSYPNIGFGVDSTLVASKNWANARLGNYFINGGNSFGGGTIILGNNDNNALNFRTNGNNHLTLYANGNFQETGGYWYLNKDGSTMLADGAFFSHPPSAGANYGSFANGQLVLNYETANKILKTDANKKIVAATPGTDYLDNNFGTAFSLALKDSANKLTANSDLQFRSGLDAEHFSPARYYKRFYWNYPSNPSFQNLQGGIQIYSTDEFLPSIALFAQGDKVNRFLMRKMSGTIASPTANAGGTLIGQLPFGSYDGSTGFPLAALIEGYTDASTSPGNASGYLALQTTEQGGITPITRLLLKNHRTEFTPQSLTGSLDTTAFTIAQTWNTTGSPNLVRLNVTNTASGDSAKFVNFLLSGVSRFSINKDGTIINNGNQFTAGNINANSFIKQGGTSSQFLKADGSVDNNTYLTTASTVNSITLNTSGAIHNSPVNFSNSSGNWSGTLSLASQPAFSFFHRGIGSGVPSFRQQLYLNKDSIPLLSGRRRALFFDTTTGQVIQQSVDNYATFGGNSTTAGILSRLGTTSNTSLRFISNNTERVVIDSNGRFGLGTTAPLNTFHLQGTSGVLSRFDVTNANADQVRGAWQFYTNTAGVADLFGEFGFKFEGGSNNTARQFQVAVGGTTRQFVVNGSGNVLIGTAASNVSSAILNVESTTKGLLLPRMTKTQRDAIASPVAGLMVYQTDNTPGLRVYNGTNWVRFTETND